MSTQPGAATDFSARLQAALGSAKGQSVKTAAPPSTPTDSAPVDDEFNQRLSAAMGRARGDPEQTADAEPETAVGGPVGQGDYVALPGDCMASIAADHGHFWETIWNDPGNSELQEVRKDPYVLLPGDRVTIPDKRRKDEQIAPEMRHRFVRRGAPEKLIVIYKVEGEPRDNQAYVLDIDGEKFEGTTAPDGRVEVFIPPDATRARIVFTESGDGYSLDLGKLDPITELIGIQKRLANLGYYHGSHDGEMSDALRQATRVFQKANEMDTTGEVDEATREKIREKHDG